MWTFCIVLAIWHGATSAGNNLVFSNGWIPVSNEVVYNQIKHSSNPESSFVTTHRIQVLNTDTNKLPPFENSKSSDDTEVFTTKCIKKDGTNCRYELAITSPEADFEYYFVPKYDHAPGEKNKTEIETARYSRKIKENFLKNYVLSNEIKSVFENKDMKEENNYEVTEKNKDILEEETETKESGYIYEPPRKQNETNGNALFEILSKYKINKDDELPNYALSRRQMTYNLLKPHGVVKPYQDRILFKSNNLNHLLVDPLLAVLLSNYGYYLQGMYGIHNRYNNLYGYLASNNIHNNRPFGFYKIFSDTDSSH